MTHHRRRGSWTRLALLVPLALAARPVAACALPVISEVFYDAVGSDNGLGFVELYGAPGAVLDGLVLEGINGSDGRASPTLSLGGAIPSDGLFVVADDLGDGTTNVAGADLILNFDFQNGPDSVVLRRDATVLDAVGYGLFGATDVFAGEGDPAPDASAGESLARRFADVDTNDNALDFVTLASPSPGSAPLAAIPEPGSALLLAAGLSGLARGGRPRPGAGRVR